jgi:hypothetical protein
LQDIFAKSYPSVQAAAEVLEGYDLVGGHSQDDVAAGLERFHSDAVFDLGIYRARTLLCAERRAKHGDANSIQPYHVEFGNPFPGPKRGCAHHGVDMIYMFDPFHDTFSSTGDVILEEQAASLHVDLVKKVQDRLIGFIVGNLIQKVTEDEIFVWGNDGSSRIEKLAKTSKWVDRIDRLKLLEKDIPSMLKVLRAL